MSLIFGNLTQQFVAFGAAVSEAKGGDADASAAARIPAAVAAFRRTSARDASYLVYICMGMMVCTYTYMTSWLSDAHEIQCPYLTSC
jgi:ATP-binding cassette, subfamily B (MDR/TAP), member 1